MISSSLATSEADHTVSETEAARSIVDTLIRERGRTVMARPWWPVLRPLAYQVLRYRQAVDMARAIQSLPALEVFDHLSALLHLKVHATGLHNVPAEGPAVLVCNHPTGIADGIALYDAIKAHRRDLSIFANRDAIRINPRLADIIVPVEWRQDFKSREKTRETLALTARAFREERVVVLFPSGRLAYRHEGRLTERPWMTSAIALARKNGAPIIPMHMGGRNSPLFYLLAQISTDLRDMTVFNELLNKAGARFTVTFGKAIDPESLSGDLGALTDSLRLHCAERLNADPDTVFTL